MKQKRRMLLYLIMVLAICIFNACSSKSDEMGAPSIGSDYDSESNDDVGMNVAEGSHDSDSSSGVAKKVATTGGAESEAAFERKVIKKATLEMEAKDASSLYEELTKYGKELGGYEFSFDITNYEKYSVISAVYKVPPDKLDQLMNYAGETGKIINSTLSSDDITDGYYDTKTRLESKRKSLEQYYALLQKATTIEEIAKVQSIIDQITEEIEANEGKLNMWNSLVDMATLELYIRQENDPVGIKKEIRWNTLSLNDMGYLIKRGLVSLLNAIISLLQWIVIAIVVSSPILVIIGTVLWIWLKKRKKHVRKHKEKDE